ncbi:MAG: hypothetical protein AB7S74_08140 [Hyphomicrobium sp.]
MNDTTSVQPGAYDGTATEAVAVFEDPSRLQDAIDELLMQNFDYAELSVPADPETIRNAIGHEFKEVDELEENPDVPRASHVPNEIIGNAQGAAIGIATYVPAMIAAISIMSSGGSVTWAVVAAALCGGLGAVIGTLIARRIGSRHETTLRDHLSRGGVVLWVRTHDADHEKRALATLKRHGAKHVHLHVPGPSHHMVPEMPFRRPLLSFGRLH